MNRVEDWPSVARRPTPLRVSMRSALGAALLTAGTGWIAYTLISYLDPNLGMLAGMLVVGSLADPDWVLEVYLRLILLACCIPAIVIGSNLLSHDRQTILFLRRFSSHSNVMISRALTSRSNWRYRLTALDDGTYPSKSVPLGPHLVVWLAAASVVPFFAILYWRSAPGPGTELIEMNPGFYLMTLRLWPAFAALIVFVMAAHFSRLRRQARLIVKSSSTLSRLRYHIRRDRQLWRRSVLMGGQASVVSVPTPDWQAAVGAAMLEADIVVIDISDPSISIRWEVEHSLKLDCTTLLLADRESLDRWLISTSTADTSDRSSASATTAAKLVAAVGDQPVLCYESFSDKGHRQLRANLSRALAELGATRRAPRSPQGTGAGWRGPTLDAAFYVFLTLVVLSWPILMVDMLFAFGSPYEPVQEYFSQPSGPIGLDLEFYAKFGGVFRLTGLSGAIGYVTGRFFP